MSDWGTKMWGARNVIFPRCHFLVYTKQWPVEGTVCMLLLLETGIKVPQGMAGWLGTTNQGQIAEGVWKASNLWSSSLKSSKTYMKHIHLVALVPIQPILCKWQAKCPLEIIISVREDDKVVNENMDRRCVLETGRSRGVVELFRFHGKSNLTKWRNHPENNLSTSSSL